MKYLKLLITLLITLIISLIVIFIVVRKNRIKIGIHTVCILKENIPFLREWIQYHIDLGIDKIFIYDNTGSIGCDGSNKNNNKYNINFNEIIKLNDDEIKKEMAEIIKEYNGKVYYDIWQPRNENNEIIYGQNESIYDYINKYGTLTDYTAFIDIDEFIVIPNNNLKKFINKHPNTTKFILKQKKFQDRYCYIDNNVLKIDDTIANIDTTNWANKLIVKNKVVEHNINNNIHSINVIKGDTYNVPIDEGWFNHYNVNLKQIEWMKQNFNKDNFDFIKDDSMQKYKYNINNNNFFNQDKLKENININCLIR